MDSSKIVTSFNMYLPNVYSVPGTDRKTVVDTVDMFTPLINLAS